MFAFRTAKPKGIELFVAFLGFALLEPVFMRLLKLQNANIHMNPPYGISCGTMPMIFGQTCRVVMSMSQNT